MAEIVSDTVVSYQVQGGNALMLVRRLSITEDGIEFGTCNITRVYQPGSDMSAFDATTQAIAAALWS